MIEEKRDHNTGARHPEAVGELISALREMLGYAEARNTDKRARSVYLKFSRLTLEMWMEKARAALSKAEAPAADASIAKLELPLPPQDDAGHQVIYDISSGQPGFRCHRCKDTMIRPPDMSDEMWNEAVEVFKRQHGVI
ncbi:hypothetical protein [Candidatus Manganitrophus noduliformans]|uniref:Uncharacterized protein n=1 Tax=Candidatus Manganitrophus noduliformans TaxID=2606439 RepID=A0A7X6DMZ2_9BACT|nr:hypothetical protein [Candidatus Manganitrophus noduliformans]NKE70213.1 hypothetical protein [Candidatus Manganitrophus noduliformans]